MNKSKQTKSITEILPPEAIDYYIDKPVEFIEDYILQTHKNKDYYITDQQRVIIESIAKHKRTSVKAGRGVGKTGALAFLILWWHSMFPEARSVAFAPSFPQLASVLWPEIAKWLSRSMLKDYFIYTKRGLFLKEDNKVNFSEPRTAAKEESAQGLHAEHLLLIIDEASGVQDVIYERLQGSLTKPNNKIILMTNPTRTSGFSYDSQNRYKRHWNCITLNSEESPIVDPSYIQEMRDKYVTPTFVHDMYKVHVLGQYPSGDPDSFLKLEDVYSAKYRTNASKDGPVELGVDIARKGDDRTVIAVRQGNYVYSAEELGLYTKDETTDIEHLITTGQVSKIPEIEELIYKVVDTAREVTGYEGTIRVKVDDTGLAGLTDYLELDEEHNIEPVPIVFSMKQTDKYFNVPSKMWGEIKDRIRDIRIPNSPSLIEELSTRKWEDVNGKIKIQPKKEFKKDYGASPDEADALILAFADIENENRIVKGYDVRDTINHGIEAANLQAGKHYCCVYSTTNQHAAAVWVTWTGSSIRVIDEYVGHTSEIIEVIKMNPSGKIIGNPEMFKKEKEDMYMLFMDNGIFLQEPYGYNEMASMTHLSKIAKDKRLVVAIECKKTSEQLRRWTSSTATNKSKEMFGLGYALTLVVSDLISNNEITMLETIGRMSYRGDFDNQIKDVNAPFMSL